VVEEAGLKVTIRGTSSGAVETPRSPAARPASPAGLADEDERFHPVLSPMTGVFYRTASPEAPPFVEVGDRVEEGQTIGLIEAMKVFSEIPADRSGRVHEVLVPNGQLVSQGDLLMRLDPAD